EEGDVGNEQDDTPVGNESKIMQVHDRPDEKHDRGAGQSEYRPASPVSRRLKKDVHRISDAKEHHSEEYDEQPGEDKCRQEEYNGAVAKAKPDQPLCDGRNDVFRVKPSGVGAKERHRERQGKVFDADGDEPIEVRKQRMEGIVLGSHHAVAEYDAKEREIEDRLIVAAEYEESQEEQAAHEHASRHHKIVCGVAVLFQKKFILVPY